MSAKTHHLKIWPEFYEKVISGEKRFEIRQNNRDYKVGDILILRKFEEHFGYYDEECMVSVTYLLHGGQFGLSEGHVCMSIELQKEPS